MTGLVVLLLRLLATATLFAYLAVAFWILWQDLQRASFASRGQPPPIRLEIRSRGRRPVVRSFDQGQIIVGREPRLDVALHDKGVSARHAQLTYHHGQWWIEDLKSTNGTRLNGDPLLTPTVLTSGDVIKCGATRLLVALSRTGRVTELEGAPDD